MNTNFKTEFGESGYYYKGKGELILGKKKVSAIEFNIYIESSTNSIPIYWIDDSQWVVPLFSNVSLNIIEKISEIEGFTIITMSKSS